MGGIGKTALALKFAEALTTLYPDGQIYLDLKGVSSRPLLTSQAMAHVIWTLKPESQVPENEPELFAAYRSLLHGKRVILVMDNASGRDQVEALIPPAGNLSIIISRFNFHVPGVRARELAELPTRDSRSLLLQIEPRIGDMADIIAGMCGGLPFALQAAAGSLSGRPDLSAGDYAERLSRGRERGKLAEASIGLSYDLLSGDSAARWRQLAVFPADFDLVAASNVWSLQQEEAEGHIGDFIVRNILQGANGRYWLHDLSRVFALERLISNEKYIAEMRHASHYLINLARNAEFFMGGNEVEALRQFDAEWTNTQAGFLNTAAASTGNSKAKRMAVLYVAACQSFFLLRIPPQEALRWLSITLPFASELGSPVDAATILNSKGLILRRLSRHVEAKASFQEALNFALSSQDRHLEVTILGNLGNESLFLGDLDSALLVLERALTLARELDDRRGELVALGGLERLYSAQRNFTRSLAFAQQWLTASRQLNLRHSEGQALGNMGIIYMPLSQPDKAIECFEANLRIARELGDKLGEAACLGNIGWAHANLGDRKSAIELLKERIALSQGMGDIRGEAESSWALGLIYEETGDLVRALELLKVRAKYLHEIHHPEADESEAKIDSVKACLAAKAET